MFSPSEWTAHRAKHYMLVVESLKLRFRREGTQLGKLPKYMEEPAMSGFTYPPDFLTWAEGLLDLLVGEGLRVRTLVKNAAGRKLDRHRVLTEDVEQII